MKIDYVISVRILEDETHNKVKEWRYACKNDKYAGGMPSWINNIQDCECFESKEEAEEWFDIYKNDLFDNYHNVVFDIPTLSIRQVVFKKIKQLKAR